jgi:hypothetical protein
VRYKAAAPAATAAPARPSQTACAVGATLAEALEDEEDEVVIAAPLPVDAADAVAGAPPLVGLHASVREHVAPIGPGSCSQQRVAIQTLPGQYTKGPVHPVIMAEVAVVVAVVAAVVAAADWDSNAVIGIGVPAVQVVAPPQLHLVQAFLQPNSKSNNQAGIFSIISREHKSDPTAGEWSFGRRQGEGTIELGAAKGEKQGRRSSNRK